MKKIKILWADDEIDLLRPHVLFLETKGYELVTVNSGDDAVEMAEKYNDIDIIFLDENMPGLSGLETMNIIKQKFPAIPIIMITKSEEENIMDEAIGSKIADYLIKPVNPKQILLAIKKNVDKKRLITEKTNSAYQSEFMKLGMEISDSMTHDDWANVYKKLVYWELELERADDHAMDDVLKMQKNEANNSFGKFIKKNYYDWFKRDFGDRPLLSPDVFKHKVFPHVDKGQKTFVILIDNLRIDQWKILQPVIREFYNIDSEEHYYSILPTATQYARNAMCAGLMPSEIYKIMPDMWLNDDEEGGKNLNEETLLKKQLARLGKNYKFNYEKILNLRAGRKLVDNVSHLLQFDLNLIIFNFVDMLSHARTDMEMIRELASDDPAYRSITLSWFEHSTLKTLMEELAKHKVKVILTTDHGSIRVSNPVKVIGDRKTTTNLRYKQGKNLSYKAKDVFEITKPENAYLPKTNVSSSYIFGLGNDFFAYPNNYNYYVNYYRDTFQHGGVSMEEMIIPLISLDPK